MTWTVSVISGGTEYNLSDNINYLLTGIDGIAAAPVVRIAERGPMQHGESDVGYRLQPRKIVLALMARGGDAAAWFTRRDELAWIFHSSNSPLKLKITSGDMVRQIDCYLNGTLEMTPEVGLAPGWQRVGIELYAPDPTWYDPQAVSHLFTLGGGGQAMQVPLAIPWTVGASAIDQSLPIYYPGTWDAFPIITIEGPIANCIITNTILGTKLDFTGLSIGSGEKRIIDCRYGYKSVVNELGQNRVYNLTNDSHLATFRIGSHPDVQGGYNTLRVQGTDITAGTRILVQYHVRYIGV